MLLRISIFYLLLLTATVAQAQTVASFETTNFPGSFLQHVDSVGYIRATDNENERNNSTFVITPSPFGNDAVFLLTSMDPTKYIRHQNKQIFAARNEHSIAFYEDASFNIRPGLSGQGVSFESINFPGHYIRHQNYTLYLQSNDGTNLFKDDSSFHQRAGLTSLSTRLIQAHRMRSKAAEKMLTQTQQRQDEAELKAQQADVIANQQAQSAVNNSSPSAPVASASSKSVVLTEQKIRNLVFGRIIRGKYYFRLVSLAPELSGLAVDLRKNGITQYNTSMQAIERAKKNDSPFERNIGQYWRIESTGVSLNGKRGYRIIYDLDGQTRALTSDQNGSGPFLSAPQNNEFQFWLVEQAPDGAVEILNYGLLKRNSFVVQLFADVNTKEVIVDRASNHSNALWNFATLVAKNATDAKNP